VSRPCRTLLLVVVGLALAAPPATAAPRVAPIQSHPHGHSYAQWGVRWYEWAFATPTSENPLAGAPCAGGQSGHVWFLHGVVGSGTAVHSCTVPTGTAVFLPLINNAYAAFLNDPADQRTDAFVRAQAACEADHVAASIDGNTVRDAARYRVDAQTSPIFEVQLPMDNILGLTGDQAERLLLSPVAQSGYYLFLHPFRPGVHTLEWQASGPCGMQDVVYTLNVAPRGRS
jgi:hypothetical protein